MLVADFLLLKILSFSIIINQFSYQVSENI